jgi:hypothetical protein
MSVTYKSNSAAAIAAIERAAMDAIEESVTKFVFEPSQLIVPLDETPLIKSGEVLRDDTSVVVSYGKGESAAYAVIQHENLQYAHPNGREAKYLEKPFRSAIPHIIGAVKASLS